MGVFYAPNPPQGNLATAIGLWDQFFGPTSKLRAGEIAGQKQQQQIAGQQEQRAQQLLGPTLADAQLAVKQHQNTLAQSDLDRQTREGSLAAWNSAPPGLLTKPTTAMSPDEMQQWTQLHQKNGVKDLGGAASAWNKSVSSISGALATPPKGYVTQFQTGPEGVGQAGGFVLPDLKGTGLDTLFGGGQPPAPGAPNVDAFNAGGGPQALPPPAPAVSPSPAAPGSAVAPPTSGAGSGGGTLPDIKSLLPLMTNPYLASLIKGATETQSALLANQEKQQGIEKGAREVAMGTPEEQNRQRDFSSNAGQLGKNLVQLEKTVGKFGSYESPSVWSPFSDPEAASDLATLPGEIAQQWRHVRNPGSGGQLRPGQENEAAQNAIPLGMSVKNATSTAAIKKNQSFLADQVRSYENDPATRLPVIGLPPEIRKLVGETKFGRSDDPAFKTPEGGAPQEFASLADFQQAQKAGKTAYGAPVKIAGVMYQSTPQGWVPVQQPPQAAAPSALPPVSLPRVGKPAS